MMSQKIDIMWLKQRTLGYWGFTLHPKEIIQITSKRQDTQKDKSCSENFRFCYKFAFTKGLSKSSSSSWLRRHDLVIFGINVVRLALEVRILSDLAGGTVNKEKGSTRRPSFVWKTVAPSVMSFPNKDPSGSRRKSWLKQLLSERGENVHG